MFVLRSPALRRRGLSAVLLVGSAGAACSSEGDREFPFAGGSASFGAETAGREEPEADSTGAASREAGDDHGATSASELEPPPEVPATDAVPGPQGGSQPTTAGAAGCPDPLPRGWLFCEDFERSDVLEERFFEVQQGGDAFRRVEDRGASGFASMRAVYEPGVEGAGWLSIALGDHPAMEAAAGRPSYAPHAQFDELYVRFHLRMERGWSGGGPHKLLRIMSLAHADFGNAVLATLGSRGNGVQLRGEARTCVDGQEVPCQGFDEAAMRSLGVLPGSTDVFSEPTSGQWRCIEVHVALNRLGADDGIFEYWVDDGPAPEARAQTLDWRGTWDDYGLNLVTLENFWPGGPPQRLTRWMDDIVVSTERIGCGLETPTPTD